MKIKSRRQKLAEVHGSGDLRYWLEEKLDAETLEFLLDIVSRYCEPKKRK